MPTRYRLLLVEDDEVDAESVARKLSTRWAETRGVEFELTHVSLMGRAIEECRRHAYDVVLLDLGLPDSQGLDSVTAILGEGNPAAIVVLTMLGDAEVGLEALRRGAEDYLPKDTVEAEGLVRSVLFAIERSRLRRAERDLRRNDREQRAAGVVQSHLLPKAAPLIPGYDIAGRCVPASNIGGDLFDFVALDGGDWGLVVADVAGHGIAAALIMAGFRQIVRTTLAESGDLKRVVALANDTMFHETPDFKFVTMALARLNPAARTLEYVGAGHRIYLLRRGCDEPRHLDSTCTGLGLEHDIDIVVGRLQLECGDILVLPTDGLAETLQADRSLFGNDRLCQIVRESADEPAERIVDGVFRAVREGAADSAADDDCTLVVVKVLEPTVETASREAR